MKSTVVGGVLLLFLLAGIAIPHTDGAYAPAGNTDHGKYLVEHVAMCIQCHTPHMENGRLIREQLLMGAAVPVTSPFDGVLWANTAPRIAGLPQYTEEDAVRLLTTGIGRNGNPLRPPMPPFRMNDQDAKDVVAYLKSLNP